MPSAETSGKRPGGRPRPRALQRWVELVRARGLRSLGVAALEATFYRRLVRLECSLEPQLTVTETPIPLEFGFIGEEALESWSGLNAEADPEVARKRMRAGERCFVAWDGPRIVSDRWVVAGSVYIEYLGRMLDLASDEVYIKGTFTHPEYRGRGVAAAALTRLHRQLSAEGYRRSVILIVPENRPAFGTAYKSGYRRVALLGRARIGPWRRHFTRPIGPQATPGRRV